MQTFQIVWTVPKGEQVEICLRSDDYRFEILVPRQLADLLDVWAATQLTFNVQTVEHIPRI
jgi:hypothetical protein